MSDIQATVTKAFETHFGTAPDVVADAPGRVNLLGEHTDYNGGYVLPIALNGLGVAIALGRGGTPGRLEAWSDTFHATETRQIGEGKAGHWSDYLLGCVQAVAAEDVAQHGLRAVLVTTLPMGAGLSSSAALEVASFRALTRLVGAEMDPVDLAVAARKVENEFVGMPCGIMDQFCISVGEPGQALFLNTRTLEHSPAPALPGHSFVVISSGVSHQLTDDGYATRVRECNAACAALGVELLSDLGPDDLARIGAIDEPMNRRARHVVTDNQLTLEGLAALNAGDAAAFGRLMVASHASERDDFQITVAETDALAEAACAAGALGARQTGGGWGGSVVALVPTPQVDALCATITGAFPQARILAVT
ncbi:MAG: galactokinase [Maritimibacter sp.]